jgi:hypothetical protein
MIFRAEGRSRERRGETGLGGTRAEGRSRPERVGSLHRQPGSGTAMTISVRGPKRPMPTVEWDGTCYSLKSRNTQVPDLASMSRIEATLWLCRNTKPRGYRRGNPLAGLAGVVKIKGSL